MTVAVEPLLPAAPPRWWELSLHRVRATPRARRLSAWLAPTLVTLLAAVLRLWNLGHPHAFVMDETYYVKDAWSQFALGYPSKWPDGADKLFLAGEVDVFGTDGSFVVHPPLGKWIIGLGMWALGPESGWGWRIMTALVGTAAVLVLILVGKRLTGSLTVGVIAGFLMAIDGLAIVMSRVAMLDGIFMFFVLLGFWFVLLDRARARDRLFDAVAVRAKAEEIPAWGPVLWNRPWVIAAGAALGAATAVKWSGLWVLGGVGIYLVLADALARRRAGVAFWPTDAIVRQGPVTFVLLVPVSFVVYLASWTGWLVTDGGYDRHAADTWWQSLWIYHQAIYRFHVGLTSEHGYESPAWQWPLLLRPTAMYYRGVEYGEEGCTSPDNGCAEAISSIPNPLLWWAGVLAVIYLVWRLIARRDAQSAFVLTGVAVTYVPWLLYPERTIFQFYTIAILPFMLLALTIALRDATGREGDHPVRRIAGRWVVLVFLVLITAWSVWYYPVWTAIQIPYDVWLRHFRVITDSNQWV